MPELNIRGMRIKDAKRFREILSNPNFRFFNDPPATIKAEEEFIRQALKDEKAGKLKHHAVIYDGQVIGGCGFKINQHEKAIAELGYFIDEAYWGQGLAGKALSLVERVAFEEYDILRAELIIDPDNGASRRVAEKAGYKLEGHLHSRIIHGEKVTDGLIYGKINPDRRPKQKQ